MRFPLAHCSSMFATQPRVLPAAKIGVKSSTGIPIAAKTHPLNKSTFGNNPRSPKRAVATSSTESAIL